MALLAESAGAQFQMVPADPGGDWDTCAGAVLEVGAGLGEAVIAAERAATIEGKSLAVLRMAVMSACQPRISSVARE